MSIKISRIFFDYFRTIYLEKQLVKCVIQTSSLVYLDIHDVHVLRGLLGLMGRSPLVFSLSSFDCFDKQRIGLKYFLNFSQ